MKTPVPEATNFPTPPLLKAVDAEVDIEVLRVVPKQFAIVDEKSASWLVRRIVAAREYGNRVRAWSEQERRRAEREEHTLLFLFGRQIEEWAKIEIDKLGGRQKSIHLPGGTVGFRRRNPMLVVDDESVVIEWAKKNIAAAIEITEKLSKATINDHFSQTGEVPPACHIEPAAEKFSIS